MWLLTLPVGWGLAVYFVLFAAITVGMFAAVRSVFRSPTTDDHRNMALWGGVRIGTLNALILSLIFAAVRSEYNELRENIDNEAAAIEQAWRGLERIEAVESEFIQGLLVQYTQMVINDEWLAMRDGQPLEAADLLLDDIQQGVIALTNTETESAAVSLVLDDTNDIENARAQRSFDIVEPVGTSFWAITLVSFILTAAGFFAFPVTRLSCTVLGAYAGATGMVVCGILALTHPFSVAGLAEPTALVTIYERTMLPAQQ
jgi:hypothetical protein